ncbi:retrovirus-related Pol polyprotein from type-1 retrotransposable element R2 [Clonorchis sinensis]|uniref:Retrovirus-related Pol polyprotein from type-1 retrotransposable element R2 n=1 Tax=Clonorchis sinensis TaxID=79923 RepID=G7Y3A0_CLOSI|nr:retrovirus-related Pol polyprotein from type-1 retrotransposable element R2 [Clonorchis sinensis]
MRTVHFCLRKECPLHLRGICTNESNLDDVGRCLFAAVLKVYRSINVTKRRSQVSNITFDEMSVRNTESASEKAKFKPKGGEIFVTYHNRNNEQNPDKHFRGVLSAASTSCELPVYVCQRDERAPRVKFLWTKGCFAPDTIIAFINGCGIGKTALPNDALTKYYYRRAEPPPRGADWVAWTPVWSCWITHDARCARHNRVARELAKRLRRLGYTVFEELRAPTSTSFIKPDLIAVRERRATVIDVSIVSDGRGVTVWNEKKQKYGADEFSLAIISALRAIGCDVDFLVHQPMIISYRGICFPQSAKAVIGLGLSKVTVSDLCLLAIVGSLRTYDTFMRGTWR